MSTEQTDQEQPENGRIDNPFGAGRLGPNDRQDV